jgi:hypothetical protein
MREAVQGDERKGPCHRNIGREHEPAGTVEQIELILLAAIDVERL